MTTNVVSGHSDMRNGILLLHTALPRAYGAVMKKHIDDYLGPSNVADEGQRNEDDLDLMALRKENEQLRNTLKLHAGDVMSLTNDLSVARIMFTNLSNENEQL